jgi:glutamyl-tRNA reductase
LSSLVCVGLSYKTAPVSIREQAVLSPQQQSTLLSEVASGHVPDVEELVILSTCNRTELYAAGAPHAAQALFNLFYQQSTLAEEDQRAATYCLADQACVRHVLRVAASLDSQIIGEPQILGQLTQAYRRARTGILLSELMRRAIHAGKRVRSETELGQGALSISAIVARHANRIAGSLTEINALIIGAGEVAQSTAASLARRGIGKLVIASRTLEHAQAAAIRFGATAVPYAQVGQALIDADILITASAAPHTLLYVADVAGGLSMRQGRPLLIFDIAMPRNVAPGVGALPGVQLFNLDDLQAEAELHRAERESAIPQAEVIIEEEVQNFLRWQASREAVPIIRQLRDDAERVRQSELARLTRRMPTLTEREQHLLDIFSERLINKLLHSPTVRLKARSAEGQSEQYTSVVKDLFNLTPDPSPQAERGENARSVRQPVPPLQLEPMYSSAGSGAEVNSPQPEPEFDLELSQP